MNSYLDSAKIRRLRQIDRQENRIPFLRRAIRRYRQLIQAHPWHIVWAYFFNRAAVMGWRFFDSHFVQPVKTRSSRARINADRYVEEEVIDEIVAKIEEEMGKNGIMSSLAYGVRITGGLGDALIVARFVRDLQRDLDTDARFDVYFHSPEAIAPFFSGIPGFRKAISENVFYAAAACYDFALVANQYLVFENEKIHLNRLVRRSPEVVRIFGHVQAARHGIERYIISHPSLDGAFSDAAVLKKKKRHTYLHEMAGIEYGGNRLPISVDLQLAARYGLSAGQYITVHDGWDNNFKLVAQRPTKALPASTWVKIVQLLKETCPELKIVQLGGKTGENIPGVDLSLKGKLAFSASLSILAQSALHIDTESGLVHIGTALGVRSVVMFGPTNADWFGYPENENIRPKACGNCWWSTDSWMDVCPAGHEVPACTASIDAREVVQAALSILGWDEAGPAENGELNDWHDEKVPVVISAHQGLSWAGSIKIERQQCSGHFG